ncbi:alpha/beta fold hydrolase [Allorhizocola rhizosphaerae]|uniref:alpha/beta fold hydrolase n=1 Tax=Allorhizocola rhizosphaerae TaxID=1872709 RepID=UPI001B8BC05A|nr:alpha/beta fold hydrolase [Allorhizocola rhizosphaerae]
MKKLMVLGLTAALLAGFATPATAAPSSPAPLAAAIRWHDCPQYSDEVLRFMFPTDRIPAFRELWARTECGTIQVPLDYRNPKGRQITVALNRVRATDQARRIGSMGFNPGGPGGSGYLMPINILFNPDMARLNERYDLIGFDPRGVGYSSKMNCAPPGPFPEPQPGPLTEQEARQIYAAEVAFNQACGNTDPAFISQLTTVSVARDLDRIRAGLGERKLSFFGVSWGTWLGVVFRNLFPERVGRMWLDSTAIPGHRFDRFLNERTAAAERNASRFATWLAGFHAEYGFGTTREQVESALLGLQRDFDANPRRFTDLDFVFDAEFIALASGQDSPTWPLAAQVLKEIRDAIGPLAPPTVKEVLSGGPGGPPPAGLPDRFNQTMGTAVFCNEDTGPRNDFAAAWAAYQRRLADNPLIGAAMVPFTANCTGWPHEPQPVHLRRSNASVVLSGHLHEAPSPYQWTWETQLRVGGSVLTVDDDVHGSVPFAPGCVAKLLAYFDTGRAKTHDRCEGIPTPTATAPPSASGRSDPGATLFRLQDREGRGRL